MRSLIVRRKYLVESPLSISVVGSQNLSSFPQTKQNEGDSNNNNQKSSAENVSLESSIGENALNQTEIILFFGQEITFDCKGEVDFENSTVASKWKKCSKIFQNEFN
eukprot:TRINITY_DN12851_c0_g1_i1.p1 TRINITY_DN12851_c0_g1~~TRINITY_DN12851_c0_g1_i1.p1  ORF type:complete len:107 (+),score=36.01 TRINITY_DN12851_c0_g1_i1:1637-1957(+)